MAADASVRGTTFEPRGPSLSIGTVGLFVNRIAGEPPWSRGAREAVKNGRQTLTAPAPGRRRHHRSPIIQSKILDLETPAGAPRQLSRARRLRQVCLAARRWRDIRLGRPSPH